MGDATCGQESGDRLSDRGLRSCGDKEPCLPVCRRQVEPHAQIPRCGDRIDETVKSDPSAEVLNYFGLGRTIGFQAAVPNTSDGKHPESSHQLIVRSVLRTAHSVARVKT